MEGMVKWAKTYLHFESEKKRRIILKQSRDGTKEFKGCKGGWFVK